MPTHKKRVAIVYHYFQHYRKGIFTELANSEEYDFEFYADVNNMYRSGVEPWKRPEKTIFHKAKCRNLPFNWMWQSGLIRLARRRDIDTIIFFGNAYYLATWASSIIGKLYNKRILFWTQGWIRQETGIKAAIRTRFYRLADALLVYGHYAKQMAIGHGLSPDSIHVVYNSLDYENQKLIRQEYEDNPLLELRAELFNDPSLPIVFCSTRMIERRRLDLLIRAAAKLRSEGQPINLLFVGDGPKKESLQALANELHVNLHFFQPCYDEAVIGQLLRISCVTVVPGMIGLTAIHSLTYGVPLISHDYPYDQMPEWEAIIPGKTGDVFARGDVDDLARVLKHWTTRADVDPAARRECIDIVERFYNPKTQKKIFYRAIEANPADDLFYLRESCND